MKLTPIERIKLLEILPDRGSILNLKIVRKMKESLSFSEMELTKLNTRNEYRCPYRENETGKRCENRGFFPEQPKCGVHNVLMEPTGRMNFTIQPELANTEKEIFMGPEALSLVAASLKTMSEIGNLTDAHISLYEKVFPAEVPEVIRKAMGE